MPDLYNNSKNSIVVNFKLYCEKNYMISLTQAIYFAFSNFSILIFTFFADKLGRRKVIIFCYSLGVIPVLIGGFSPNYIFFMVLFIISGTGIAPYMILIFVLMQEQSNEDFRQKTTLYLLMTWGIGQIIFVPIAYYLGDWDILVLYVMGIPMCIQIISFYFIYESVKWLVISKNYAKAKLVLV